ncbi:MAG: glycoside hydrolase family 31 protein [Phycisphaerales bacterium]
MPARPAPFAAIALVALVAAAGHAQTVGVVGVLGDGIYRWDASDAARGAAVPSMSFENPASREQTREIAVDPASLATRPRFQREQAGEGGRARVEIDIAPGTSLYGTGQAAGPLLRNGRVTECWNTDAYGYQDDAPSLYTSHPWVLAVRADGTAFGVLADTTYRCEIDLRDGIVFRADGPEFPVIVIEGDSPQDVMVGLGSLVGTIAMPPRWAIGYHQCRYSYNPESRVREVAQGFRERNIPADVMWMDIDYMHGYRVFTFDHEQFPDPAGLNQWLDTIGFSNVWMIDPGVKDEPGYFVRDEMIDRNMAVLDAAGEVYRGEVWPGWCVFPDYTMADTRQWWAGLYRDFMGLGIDGVWNDMNEPAVFNVPTKTMPEDNQHRADSALGGPATHDRFHNVYAMLMVQGTREGVVATNPNLRPFVLSRANFMGGHRYGATWTGDNTANWYHVDASIPMTLNLSLSGQPFCGPDIGGFAENGTPEMFQRWIGFGALFPFARGHTGKGNIDKEPWTFGEEVEASARRALEQRYILLPHLYTLFHESSVTGMPIARPTFFADPTDQALRGEDNSFLLGDGLLVVAQTAPLMDRVAVMPRGVWEPLGLVADDPALPDLYLRAGEVLPTGPIMQHTRERPLDPLTLWIVLDENGRAEGTLYEDAGEGLEYLEGEYLLTTYEAVRSGDLVTVRVRGTEGDMPRPSRRIVVNVMGGGRVSSAQGVDGQDVLVPVP